MKKIFLNLVLVGSIVVPVLLSSCNKGKDKPEPAPANQAPNSFDLVGVANGASNVDLMPNFSWTAATDPDGDTVTYDLYIGSNENPICWRYYGNKLPTAGTLIFSRALLLACCSQRK